MNIFILNESPKQAAIEHCDKHVVKMILESAQILSTAHRILDGTQRIEQRYVNGSLPARYRNIKVWDLPDWRNDVLYKATHINHPCSVWGRESVMNYQWLWELMSSLCDEYYHRYGQYKKDPSHHKVRTGGLEDALAWCPNNMKSIHRTEFPQTMPDQYKAADAVQAYRNYYLGEKRDMLKYTNREEPSWL